MPLAVTTRRRADAVPLAVWVAVVVLGIVVGGWLTARHPELHTDAAPFHGHWDLVVGVGAVVPVLVGAALVLAAPIAAHRLRWRQLLVATPLASLAWAVALAVTVGGHGFAEPMRERGGYLEGVPLVHDLGHFLRTFTSTWRDLPTHVKGHPPGLVALLWVLDRIGLGGPGWAAALVIAAGATAAAAVLLAVREVAGEATARRVAPFVVVVPAAVWMATSGDALFTAVAAWAVATTVLATARPGRLVAVGAGVLWAAALLLSYGLVLVAPVAVAVAWWRRRWDVVVVSAATAGAVLVAAAVVTGFWWPAGLAATRVAYHEGYAAHRPGSVFVWLNLCALAVAVGPAAFVAFGRLRWNGAALLASAALVGIALADASLLSKAEVERIWLPWVPWLLVATASIPAARHRRFLAGQAVTGIAVQLALRSTW